MFRFRRLYSQGSLSRLIQKYPIGATVNGYKIQRVLPLPEFKLACIDLSHVQTGAQHLHIDSSARKDDDNNVFSVSFRTQPPNDKGVPHILEHTTLCGSEKYPVHDPFFKMLNRSMANFMNAMTGSDYTFYPFATTNEKDYNNLMKIYLDATFNPLLANDDFIQEGWRLENKDINDIKSPLIFKGVVYNEMKGQVSNSDYYFYNQFQRAVYPSLNNSGGDPKFITDLTHDELVEFHDSNYHPSNSKTFSYGNFPLINTLKTLNDEFVKYGRRNNTLQKLFPIDFNNGNTKHIKVDGYFDPMFPKEKQYKSSLTWNCGSTRDVYDSLLLKILSSILLDGQSSIFYQQLIETGLGTDFSINTGIESQTEANLLSIGLQGMNAQDVDKLPSLMNNIFKEFISKPIDSSKIDAILHQIELSKKDHKSNFGMQLLYSVQPGWAIDIDPFKILNFDELINKFKEDYKTQGNELFYNLIKKTFLTGNDSNGYLQFTMAGKENLAELLEAEESTRLAAKIEELDDTDKKLIFERGISLKKKQESQENISVLPGLDVLEDIPTKTKMYPISQDNNKLVRITDTNGITYLRGKLQINDVIPKELYKFLPLFSDSLTQLGTATQKFSEIEEEIKLYTGGISTHVNGYHNVKANNDVDLNLEVSGWALNSQTDRVIDMWKKLISQTDFIKNKDQLKILIKMISSSSMSSVSESGHLFAMRHANAYYSKLKSINETMSGIEQLSFIMKLSKIIETGDEVAFDEEVIKPLLKLQDIILNLPQERLKFFMITDSLEQSEYVSKSLNNFQSLWPKESVFETNQLKTNNYPLLGSSKSNRTILKFPFQTNYAARSQSSGINDYLHRDNASLVLLSQILSFKFLHHEVRERFGAYGVGMTYDSFDGNITYYSYRDPQPNNSLRVFNELSETVKIKEITKQDLNDGKLKIFQSIDAPMNKQNESVWNFNYNITDEMRQERRNQLLNVTMDDLHSVWNKYLPSKGNFRETIVGDIPVEKDENFIDIMNS
ncbi:presequence protease, mitochondrial [Monosporozyma servazzii]